MFHIGLPGPDERREYCRRLLGRGDLAARLSPSLDVEALAGARATLLDAQFAEAVLEQVEELRAHQKRMRDPDALAEMSGGERMSFR